MKRQDNIMPENNPEEDVLDDTDYFTKTDLSKPSKVSEQLSRILLLRSVDLREGYTTWETDRNGEAHPKIIADSRKAYIGSVIALKLLLSPEIKANETYKELVDEFEKKKKELFNQLAYRERINRVREKEYGAVKWLYSGRVYLPEIGAILPGIDDKKPNSRIIRPVPGLWDNNVNLYWSSLVELCDELFGTLNDLIHYLKYFEGGGEF